MHFLYILYIVTLVQLRPLPCIPTWPIPLKAGNHSSRHCYSSDLYLLPSPVPGGCPAAFGTQESFTDCFAINEVDSVTSPPHLSISSNQRTFHHFRKCKAFSVERSTPYVQKAAGQPLSTGTRSERKALEWLHLIGLLCLQGTSPTFKNAAAYAICTGSWSTQMCT